MATVHLLQQQTSSPHAAAASAGAAGAAAAPFMLIKSKTPAAARTFSSFPLQLQAGFESKSEWVVSDQVLYNPLNSSRLQYDRMFTTQRPYNPVRLYLTIPLCAPLGPPLSAKNSLVEATKKELNVNYRQPAFVCWK